MAGIAGRLGDIGAAATFSTLKKQEITEVDEESDIDEDELEQVEESAIERLIGLSEMVPEQWWIFGKRSVFFSYWLFRRSTWIIGTSMALLWLPAFIENQRQEMIAMQDMQTKQLILGPGLPGQKPI